MSVTTNRIPALPGERPPRPPLYDQFFYIALCKVVRGEIGTTSLNGALRHRTDELPARVVGALFVLYRDGFVALGSEPNPRDGWRQAKLTSRGIRLLADWGGPVTREP
ncbi:MAG TPA: hypothetical protein VJT49_23975 [Amycolatopsis sp.]|uniref:hypothetical protein n=1 Tax=Amycolatopsis sp. TaxID=37632 RepID=UPI002B45F1D6|nr:hypothetical protein [Amycolatopsis sp.]HKS48111.1 hypothetical protein [Amycolatopsis sp.]